MFEPILEVSLKAALLLALGLLMGRAMRGVSASRRHFVYGLTVVAALALAPITLAAPGWLTLELPVERPAFPGIDASIELLSSMPSAEAAGRSLPVVPFAETPGEVQPVTGRPAGSSWPAFLGAILAAIYLAGLLLLLGGLARSVMLLRALAHRATDVPEGDWRLGVLSRVSGDQRRAVRLAETAACSVPFVWGVRHPVILVPADSAAWPLKRLEGVLIHEIAHVRQFDVLLRVAAEVLCALQWLNPLTWMLARRLRADGEAACDDAVLAAGVEPADYAGELLGLGIERRWHLRVAGAMSGGSPLGRRITAVLDDRLVRSAITRPQRWGITFLIGCCFAVLVAADWQHRPAALPAPPPTTTRAAVAPAPASGATGESSATAPDANASGAVQLRWQSGPESGAAFLGGTIDLDSDPGVAAAEDAFFLLVHRATDGSIRSVSAWGEEEPRWVERDLALVGRKLGGLGDRIRWKGAPLSTFANDPAVSQVSGSVMTGLPATTEDGSRGSLVAGWQSGADRVGLFACGAPGFGMDARAARALLQRTIDRDGHIADLGEGECLVAFAWNADRRELRLFESYRAIGGSVQTRFSDGARSLPTASSAEWLRELLSFGRTHLGLRP